MSIADGKPTWGTPLLFLPARSIFLFASQAIFALVYQWRGHASPWSAAGAWWTVWGTIADLGCLAVLLFLTRSERVRIRDLLGNIPHRVFLRGLGFFFVVAPFSALGSFLASKFVYGLWQAPMPSGVLIARHLPLWAILYSLIVWPLIWSATEELTYNGYLAPRIAALSGKSSVAVVAVGFWWAAQHCFLPAVPDWRFVLWRFLAFVLGVLALLLLYLRTKNLASVIVAHWILDVIAAATTLSFQNA